MGKHQHLMEGINSRLDGIQAAILNVKLKHLSAWTDARRQIADSYDRQLSRIPGITIPPRRPDCEHVFHLYVIQTEQRDPLRDHLRQREIPTAINYPCPLPLVPAYDYLDAQATDFPTAAHHASQILSLPIYPELSTADVTRVANAIEAFQQVTATSG